MRKITYSILMVLLAFGPSSCDAADDSTDVTGPGNGNSRPVIAAAITIDSVLGLTDGHIPQTGQVTFSLRMANNTGSNVRGFTNGLRVYSPNGARWSATVADSTDAIGKADFDLIWLINYFSANGQGADTIALAASVMNNPVGMPAGFNDVTHTITIGSVGAASAGKTICIDSAYYPPSGDWLWSVKDQQAGRPTWSGPHCYDVAQ